MAGGGLGAARLARAAEGPLVRIAPSVDASGGLADRRGLTGLALHVVNDRRAPFSGEPALRLLSLNGVAVETADHVVDVGPGASSTVGVEHVPGGSREINRAYRFGPPAYDVLVATLRRDDGSDMSEVVYLRLGHHRPAQVDVGLEEPAHQRSGGDWPLTVSSRLFAQSVAIDIPGSRPSDSWFHFPPGRQSGA